MPTPKQQTLNRFTQKQSGLIIKMQRYYGGEISIERALMHYGIAPFKKRSRNCTEMVGEAKWFREWAETIPWFELRECLACKNGNDRRSWKLLLIAENLPQVEAIAS